MTTARKPRRARRAAWTPDLVACWRDEAKLLRAHGAVEAAATKEHDANLLALWLASYMDAPLTLQQASTESGYSRSHLRRLLARRVLENVGENGELRLRRGDLPRKARTQRIGPDLAATVLGLPGGAR